MLRASHWGTVSFAALALTATAACPAQTEEPYAIATVTSGDASGNSSGDTENNGVYSFYACGGPGGQAFPILVNSPPDTVPYVQPGSITVASNCDTTQGASGTVTASTSPGTMATGSGSISASVDGINADEDSSSSSALFEYAYNPDNWGSTAVEVRVAWGPPGNESVQVPPTYTLAITCLGLDEELPTQCSQDLPQSATLSASGSIDEVVYLAPGMSLNASLSVSANVSYLQGAPQSALSAGQYTLSLAVGGQDQGKNLGPCPCGNPAVAGEPVNVATGNEFQTETDYTGGSSNSLALRREYNSQANASGLFGENWSSNYESAIRQTDSYTVQAARPDGRVETFGLVSGAWQADPDVTDRLTALSSGWQLTTPDDSVEAYDSNGRLLSITTRAGLVTTLNYDGSGRLVSVAGPFGYLMTFGYNGAGQVAAMTTPGGQVFTYSYDGSGNLVSVEYPDSTTKQYLYEDSSFPHALTGVIDQDGTRFTTISYDTQGRAVSTQHAGGADLTTIAYNADGSVQVTDANGNAHEYALATQYGTGKPESISGTPCPQCGGQAFTYDQFGFLASRTDWNGNVTTYLNDQRGLEVERTEAAGTPIARTITTAWDQTFHLPDFVEEPNQVTEYSYDSTGNLLQKVEYSTSGSGQAAPPVWSYTYDQYGHALTAKGPRTDVSQVTTNTYDVKGNLSTVTDALGHVTQYPSYDADGRLLESVDPNGLGTQFTYDALGRLTSRNVGGLVTSYSYDPAGQLLRITQPDGSFVAMTYDVAHRLTKVADNFGNAVVYTLDAMGNRIKVQGFDASGVVLTTHSNTYDALNRLSQSIGAQGQTTVYEYDNNSNETSVTDPLGQITQLAYDALNRRVSTEDPTEATTAFGYDASDDLTSVSDARGLTTQYTYDGLGDQLSVSSPDTGVTQTAYDSAGDVVSRTDSDGRPASYSYDALNRVTQIRYSGTIPTNFNYDQGPNGVGRLTGMSDASGSTSWSYDQQGRVIGKSQTVGAATLVTTYAYDAAGRLASIQYPSGAVIQYGYTANLVTLISVDGVPVLSNITYQGFQGPVSGWTWGNGTSYTRSFDTDGRLDEYSLGTRSRQLTYDAAGRIAAYTDSNPALSQSFGYDAADRLTQYSTPGGTETYGYDAVGNRTSLTNSFAGGTSTAYSYSAASNQLTGQQTGSQSVAYSYDPTGNLVSDGVNRYVYDGRNRLIEASNVQGLTYYAINGLGQRVAKLSGPPPDLAGDANHDGVLNSTDLRLIGLMITHAIPVDLAADCNHDGQITTADVTCVQAKIANMRLNPQSYVSPTGTTFAYDQAGHLLGEYGGNVPTEEMIYLGAMPVAVLEGGSVYYIYTDQVDAPRVIVNSSNTPVWDWEGEPFGSSAANQSPSGSGTFTLNLRFAGQYFDQETGLHYNMARDYRPSVGRYIESDPIGLQGGPDSYIYARGAPVTGRDPSGQQEVPPVNPLFAAWDIGAAGFAACWQNLACRAYEYELIARLEEYGDQWADWLEKLDDASEFEQDETATNSCPAAGGGVTVPVTLAPLSSVPYPDQTTPFSPANPTTPFGPYNPSPVTQLCPGSGCGVDLPPPVVPIAK